MPSNITIKVTADLVDLTTKMQLSKAEVGGLTTEMNKLSRQAVASGQEMTVAQKQALTQLVTDLLNAKARTAELASEIRNLGNTQFANLGRALSEGVSAQATLQTQVGFQNLGRAITEAATAASGGVHWFGTLKGELGGLSPVLGSLGLVFAASELIHFAESSVTAAADVQKLADILDIDVEKLQAYQFAARESGVDTDTAATALKRFIANLGELQKTGTGPMADDLRLLGLTADELAGDPTSALITVARAWNGLSDAEARAAIERDFFGRSGIDTTAMLRRLAQGSGDVTDKWKEMAQEARDAGEMMSPKLTQSAKDSEIALDSLGVRMRAGLAIALRETANDFYELTKAIGSAVSAAANSFVPFDALGNPIGGSPAAPPKARSALPQPPAPTFLKPQAPDVPEPKIDIERQGGADKAASEARRIADEVADAWKQSALARNQADQQANSFLLEMGQQTLDEFVAQAQSLEEKRYGIELDGLHRRESADANDKVALAKDQADEQVLAQQHANRLAEIDQDYQRRKRQAASQAFQDFKKLEDSQLEEAIKHYDAQYNAGQITSQEKHDLEQAFTLDVEKQVLARFDAENAALKAGTDAYRHYMDERRQILDGFTAHVEQQNDTLAKEQAQKWIAANKEIISAEGTFISSVFQGRQTLGQDVLQAMEQLLQKEITADAAYWTERALLALTGVGRENAAERGGFLMNLLFSQEKKAAAVSATATDVTTTQAGEAAKTGAVAAGATAQTAIKTTAAAVGNAAEAAADSTSIFNSAYTAGASAFKWVMQEVPFPLNVALAPIAAAAAFTAVAAFNVIKSAEGGDEMVTGGLYQLHPKEMVMKASIADPMRDFFSDDRVRSALAALGQGNADFNPRTFDGSLSGASAAAVMSVLGNSRAGALDFSRGLGGGLAGTVANRTTVPDDIGKALETAVLTLRAETVSSAQGGNTYNIKALDTSDFESFLRKAANRRALERHALEASTNQPRR